MVPVPCLPSFSPERRLEALPGEQIVENSADPADPETEYEAVPSIYSIRRSDRHILATRYHTPTDVTHRLAAPKNPLISAADRVFRRDNQGDGGDQGDAA
jgi:hypothetical protein